MRVDRRGRVRAIEGDHADDVMSVWQKVAEQAHHDAPPGRSPWASGSFYLTLLLVAVAAFLAVGSLVSGWAVLIVVIATLLGVSTVGILQLRHDDRLSEHRFVRLMLATTGKLPAVMTRRSPESRQHDSLHHPATEGTGD